MTFASTSKQIAVAVIGLALAALGGFFLWRVMQPTMPPTAPDRHLVYFFAGLMVTGALMIAPDVLLDIGQRLMAIWLEYKNGKVAPLFFGLALPLLLPRFPLPNTTLTPGVVLTQDTKKVCTRGYAGSVRNVPGSLSRAVYLSYGVKSHPAGAWEMDHLISLELGGSNSPKNLWPEPAPGFHSKDSLENALHRAVCAKRIPIDSAQRWISRDWLSAYRAMKRGQL